MHKILSIFKGHRLFCFSASLSSVALYGAFSMLDPMITKYLIDRGIVEHRMRLFALLATAVVIAGVLFRVGILLNMLLIRRLQNAVTQCLTMRMLNAYFATACPEATSLLAGYSIARIYDEPAQLAAGVVTGVINLCVYSASLFGSIAVSFYLANRLTAVLLVVVPVLFWLSRKFQPRISEAFARENEEEAQVRGAIGQVTEAYKTIKMFNLESSVVARICDQLARRLDLGYHTVRTSTLYETGSGVLLSIAEALVLVGAAYEVVNNRMSIGSFFAFMSCFWKVVNAGGSLIAEVSVLAKVSGQVDRLVAFEDLPKDEVEEQSSETIGVELQTVAVNYGDKTVFEDFNLVVNPGERLLILGANGSGKSTLANLMSGFARASRGRLMRPRRDRITALLTPFHFIPGTLKENVNFGSLSKAKRAVFESLAASLDLADSCNIDLSRTFSEGEKKKAQIIMTLLKDADLCIFDEPLANLDTESKHRAMELIRQHTRGKTLVMIMHGDDEFHRYFDRVIWPFSGGQRGSSKQYAYSRAD